MGHRIHVLWQQWANSHKTTEVLCRNRDGIATLSRGQSLEYLSHFLKRRAAHPCLEAFIAFLDTLP